MNNSVQHCTIVKCFRTLCKNVQHCTSVYKCEQHHKNVFNTVQICLTMYKCVQHCTTLYNGHEVITWVIRSSHGSSGPLIGHHVYHVLHVPTDFCIPTDAITSKNGQKWEGQIFFSNLSIPPIVGCICCYITYLIPEYISFTIVSHSMTSYKLIVVPVTSLIRN